LDSLKIIQGQFGVVLANEVSKIKMAFKKFDSKIPYTPKLTILTCGKRPRTRFFPTEVQHADRNGNTRPGTVVDRGITAVYDHDFYLQGRAVTTPVDNIHEILLHIAHGSILGTSHPVHYYVLHDEIGFSPDELQTLTNNLSYMFVRATRAVRLASPAYYADLACKRGRCYLHSLLHGVTDVKPNSQGYPDDTEVFEEARRLWRDGRGVGHNIRKTMFYI
jgi:eukaryotic translation initiation factor 2C